MTAPISLAAAHEPRTAEVSRDTAETKIKVRLNLDGTGESKLATGIGFFDHMLDQIARHGLIDLDVQCEGDLHIDGHHTVEDVGITLGQAFARAVGDKKGIRRYGHAYVPLDEALSRFLSGEIDKEAAVKAVSDGWTELNEEIGTDEQLTFYKATIGAQ